MAAFKSSVAVLLAILASDGFAGAAIAATLAVQSPGINSILTVNRTGTGAGTVTSSVGLINCGVTCSDSYANGTSITLTAAPGPGSQFTGWLGPCTGTGACQFTINGATTALAAFAPAALGTPTLDIDGTATNDALTDGLLVIRYLFGLSGSALINGAVGAGAARTSPVEIGDYLGNIRPTLDIDGDGRADALTDGLLIIRYLFGLRGAALIAGAVGPGAIRGTAAALEAQILGLFPLGDPVYTLDAGLTGTGSGTMTSSPAGIDCGMDCSENYPSGTSVVLTPLSSTGSTFSGWGGACAGTGACSVTMDAARYVSATFTLDTLVPPPTIPAVATGLLASTAFLYSGSGPIQTGVAPATIEARRAAVLRGRVLGPNGAALPGVTITVFNHPEFGQTLSRADGAFDLVVNGGGLLTISYRKSGLISAQRQVNAPWQTYIKAPDVALIPLDSRVTAIDLAGAATVRVAQGNPVTDADGARQATILFPAGTVATMTLANGSTAGLTTFNVRATEFTVGSNGPKMMPATLPPTSGYTYEVEYSIDEADAAGATRVTFSDPLISYTQNFLGFPVGALVPSGEYDRKKALWIATESGRVIKILSISQGLAALDINGSGMAASAPALAAMGIGTEERQQLALLYPSGQSLWRVPISHFLALD
ncbi:MAG: hypothetical protein ABI831_14100 [Betaproteobacteria bacterium]